MKKKANYPNGHCIIAIYAEDKKGILGEVLKFFNRKNYEVRSLNVSRTDINDLVLITMEAIVSPPELAPLLHRLEKIVEIYKACSFPTGDNGLDKVGFYRLSANVISTRFWSILQKYGAAVSSLGKKSLVIRKTGSDHDLEELYSQLEGPYLLGFCQSWLIAEDSLMAAAELFE
jgi:acetolactate synthase-1/3 small subunit